MRLFVAAELSAELKETVEDTLGELSQVPSSRLVPPENLHVTLAFLGDVGEERIPQLKQALDVVACGCPPFEAELSELGHFGSEDKALLWQGFEEAKPFEELAASVRAALGEESFTFDEKPFVPHVTLARKFDMAQLGDFLPFGDVGIIEKVTLFQSKLSQEGAAYVPLHTAHLGRVPRFEGQPMLFIDADACPVTAQALHEARKAKVPVCLAGNTTQNLLKHVRKEDPTTPRKGYWVTTLVASIGADSADYAIAQNLKPGDCLVTQDIGLASMALGAGASALGVRGKEYTQQNIDNALFMRHVEKKERRQGGRTSGPRAFCEEDRQRFARNLRRLLAQMG